MKTNRNFTPNFALCRVLCIVFFVSGSNSDQSDQGENKADISRKSADSIPSLSQIKTETSQSDINRHSGFIFSTGSLSHLSQLTSSVMRQPGDVLASETSQISKTKQTLSKNFAEEFHRSVLQTTRQKELTHKSGECDINTKNMWSSSLEDYLILSVKSSNPVILDYFIGGSK